MYIYIYYECMCFVSKSVDVQHESFVCGPVRVLSSLREVCWCVNVPFSCVCECHVICELQYLDETDDEIV